MKKKQLETLEKINEERKLDEKTKEKICKKVFINLLFANAVLLFFMVLRLMALNLDKNVNILIYKILSGILLATTLALFEIAYKKDSDSLAIISIEMLCLSIATLLTPYTLISKSNIWTSIMGIYFAIYYSIKNIATYRKEKSKYLKEKNDIAQIVKKESKDELAKEQLEKIKQENEEKPKRKRGRPKKVKTEV